LHSPILPLVSPPCFDISIVGVDVINVCTPFIDEAIINAIIVFHQMQNG
jgi:hypothetical protein